LQTILFVTFTNIPPGTSESPLISPSFSSGQRNRAYWASQPQNSVTLQPQPGRGEHEVWEDMWWHWGENKNFHKHPGWCSAVRLVRFADPFVRLLNNFYLIIPISV